MQLPLSPEQKMQLNTLGKIPKRDHQIKGVGAHGARVGRDAKSSKAIRPHIAPNVAQNVDQHGDQNGDQNVV